MSDGGLPTDELRLRHPAVDSYADLARLTVSGLALRLGYEVAAVESFRQTVDEVARQLCTGSGHVELLVRWTDSSFVVRFTHEGHDLPDSLLDRALGDPAMTVEGETAVLTLTKRTGRRSA